MFQQDIQVAEVDFSMKQGCDYRLYNKQQLPLTTIQF